MTKRPAYEWLLEWGVIDHRHEQSILRWQRIRNTDKPPLCHFSRVLHRHIPFGHLFDLTLKSNTVEPGSYYLELLARLCRDPDYVADLRKKCETITAVIRRYEKPAPADEIRPLFRWLVHWAYLGKRAEWAIECYTEGQLYPTAPSRIWLDLMQPAQDEARLRGLLVETTEAGALAFTQTEEWPRLRFAPDAASSLMIYLYEGWLERPPYTEAGEIPFLRRPRNQQLARLASIHEHGRHDDDHDGEISEFLKIATRIPHAGQDTAP